MTAEKQSSFAKSSFKVLFLGEYGVGKSSFILRLMERRFLDRFPFDNNESTFTKSYNFGPQRVTLRLVDTQGVERFRALTSSSFRDAAVIVFVFDVTVAESFRKLEDWLVECQRYGGKRKYIKILIASKCDLVAQRTVTDDEARRFAISNGMTYFAVSAKTGEKVDEAVESIARQINDGGLGTLVPASTSIERFTSSDRVPAAPSSSPEQPTAPPPATRAFIAPKKDSSSGGGGCMLL